MRNGIINSLKGRRIVLVFLISGPLAKNFDAIHTIVMHPLTEESRRMESRLRESQGEKNLFQVAERAARDTQVIHGVLEGSHTQGFHASSLTKVSFSLKESPFLTTRPHCQGPVYARGHWRFVRTHQVRGANRFFDKTFDISFSFYKIIPSCSTIRYRSSIINSFAWNILLSNGFILFNYITYIM